MAALVLLTTACASGGRRAGSGEAPLSGGCGTMRDLAPRYLLPYPAGSTFELTQGNCGPASHGGRFRYSFDFRMPAGSPVVAARDGIVSQVRDDRPDDTAKIGDENFVIIWHSDGYYSRYIHLQRGGALVRRGQRVSAGDTIARSGNSGLSAFPHLHFDVAGGCRSGRCVTVPSAFLNATPPVPHRRGPVTAGPLPVSESER